jgi:hypothetical protein
MATPAAVAFVLTHTAMLPVAARPGGYGSCVVRANNKPFSYFL